MTPHMTQHTLTDWNPEDARFWASTGRRIARRNLIFSIFAEHLGFSVWTLWSVVVVALPATLFPYTVDQKFWLVALPNLVGALMRLPYTFAVTRIGGRTWTAISALLLLIPVSGLIFAVTARPPYWVVLACAATAGLGGGNFASSMTNISFFYPEREKGTALGFNAAGGNIGISTMQLVVPLVLSAGLVYGGLMWIPLVVAAAICAYLFMNTLEVAKSPFKSQFATLKRPHTWVMSFLYIGTFGSFLGYSAAFPLVLKLQFPQAPVWHLGPSAAVTLAFTGPLVGSLARHLHREIARPRHRPPRISRHTRHRRCHRRARRLLPPPRHQQLDHSHRRHRHRLHLVRRHVCGLPGRHLVVLPAPAHPHRPSTQPRPRRRVKRIACHDVVH